MSASPRDPLSPLQFGEVRTVGLSSTVGPDGTRRVHVASIEARDATLDTPLGRLRAANATLEDVTILLRAAPAEGGPLDRLAGFTVGELRLAAAILEPRRVVHRAARPRENWRLEPIGALDGTVHADIVDAVWVFDVDVTMPIKRGRIDFNRVSVEHVGPDSSMGISRMGVYVDAPNGRTYLYLLSATHVPGATFERRGTLLPPWASGDRGAIELQPFLECLLAGLALGAPSTETRGMLARTRVSGDLRLGDGVIGDDRNRLVLRGREQGRNRLQVASSPSGAGILLRVPELEAGEARLELPGRVLSTGALSATASLQVEGAGTAPSASVSVSVNVVEMTLRHLAYRVGDDVHPGHEMPSG